MAHGDFSDAFKEQLLEMYKQGNPSKLLIGGEDVGGMGITDEDTLRRGRLVTLNFWRALKEKGDPLRRAPLAVCDATTMRADDMRVYAHDPQPPPPTTTHCHCLICLRYPQVGKNTSGCTSRG